MNIIIRMLAWKQYFCIDTNRDEESGRFQRLWEISFYLLGLFFISDVPFLGWLDYVKGYVGKMKRTTTQIDNVVSKND